VYLALQVTLLLALATALGSIARRLHQPAVLGEILGGIALGPTILGTLAPDMQSRLFPLTGEPTRILHAIAYAGLMAFIFLAGLEVDLRSIGRRRRSTLFVSALGILLPLSMGLAMVLPQPSFWGVPEGDVWAFALFMGTALSISALPVISRILMDLGLLRGEPGMIIIGAATCDDLVGWSLFALITSSLDGGTSLALKLGLILGVPALAACLIYLVSGHGSGQLPPAFGQAVDLIAVSTLVLSIVSELLGGHGIFGVFLAGVILSQRQATKERLQGWIRRPVIVFLAPLYFGSIGLRADFGREFVPGIVLLVFVAACAGKIVGAALGAWAGGIRGRDALAIGFGLNARGAMEIVLASAALDSGLIDERIFVALVIMALATTMISGIMIQKLLVGKPEQEVKGLGIAGRANLQGL